MILVPSFQRLVLLVLLAAFAAGSAFLLVSATAAGRWTVIAARIELSREPLVLPDGQRQRLAERLGPDATLRCGFRRERAAVTVAFFLYDQAVREGAPAARQAEAADQAGRVVRAALDCSPTDGNLWYALAVLERMGGAGIQRQRDLVAFAAEMAPAEGRSLLARAAFVATYLLPPGFRGTDGPFVDDLRRAVALLPGVPTKSILKAVAASGNPDLAARLLAEVPEERRLRLQGIREGPPRVRELMRRSLEIDPFASVRQ